MNTNTESKVISDLERDLSLLEIKTATKVVPMRQMLEEIDRTDLRHQTSTFQHMLHVEAASAIEALRHRADMMRRRADEFDAMADSYSKAVDNAVKDTTTISGTHEAILGILDEHAHIKPTRT